MYSVQDTPLKPETRTDRLQEAKILYYCSHGCALHLRAKRSERPRAARLDVLISFGEDKFLLGHLLFKVNESFRLL